MRTIKTNLAEVLARPIPAAEQARLVALAARPESEIDFTDQENITPEKIASGRYVVVRRGGARLGAGRPAAGKCRKTVKLSPDAIRRFQDYASRQGLPDFSAALESASRLV